MALGGLLFRGFTVALAQSVSRRRLLLVRYLYTLQHSTTATSELIASRSLHNFPTCRSESEPAAAPPRPGRSWSAEAAAALAQLFPAKIKIQSSSGRLAVLLFGYPHPLQYSSVLNRTTGTNSTHDSGHPGKKKRNSS